MMAACSEYENVLNGLLDGELDAANTLACEQHIAECTGCAAALAQLEQLRLKLRAVPLAQVATDQVRARVTRMIDDEQRRSRSMSRAKTVFSASKLQAWSAAVAIAATIAFVVLTPVRPDPLLAEVVAGHVRALQANHLTDIETSDKHVVKPWFTGKLDFSPPVFDLAAQGFPLVGGRLDYLQNRSVAALAYRHHVHTINLFVWPAAGAMQPVVQTSNGFNVLHWQAAGMAFWAVSDVGAAELKQFQQVLAAQLDTPPIS